MIDPDLRECVPDDQTDLDAFVEGPSQQRALRRISQFLTSRCGGILLVTGERGVGKTRLVDHALNHWRPAGSPRTRLIGRILSPLFGRDCTRTRLTVCRRPRMAQRLILPVAVDPFFPKPTTEPSAPTDPDADVLALIQNLVFGLTSSIDARGGARRFGRTLGTWIGWLGLWLSPTAFYRLKGKPGYWEVFAWTLLAYLAGMAIGLGLAQSLFGLEKSMPSLPGGFCDFANKAAIGAITYGLVGFASWILLRALDLRGLRLMGSQLYDLVHAQTMGKEVQKELERNWRADAKWQGPIVTIGILALLTGGIGLVDSEVIEAFEFSIPKLTSALLTVAGVFALSFTGLRRQRQHASFGAENRVWMITLLRRFLFQLHRAGFEPVLVIDEIDKLAKEVAQPDPGQSAIKKSSANSENQDEESKLAETTTPPLPPSELDRFETSLTRMKQSLGAEFMWILIDSGPFVERIIDDRRKLGGMGQLGTLVQDEVYVQPLPYRDEDDCPGLESQAKTYLGADLYRQYRPHLASWWLLSGGNFFKLRARMRAAKAEGLIASLNPERQAKAELLVALINFLGKSEMQKVAGMIANTADAIAEMQALLAASYWHREQIWHGMLSLARQIYDPALTAPGFEKLRALEGFNFDRESLPNDPKRLRSLGQWALFAILTQTYRHGIELNKGQIIPSQHGVDQHQAMIKPDLPVRLTLKDPENLMRALGVLG